MKLERHGMNVTLHITMSTSRLQALVAEILVLVKLMPSATTEIAKFCKEILGE